jgi:DNA-binding PadR family transcriptional regulator
MKPADRKPVSTFGPLTAAVFHILLALADGRKHGYAIMKQVAADGGSNLRMGPGTLYGSLQRMAAAGLVEEREEDDERRRYYQLTAGGQRALRGELDRLRQALAAARRKRVPLDATARRT